MKEAALQSESPAIGAVIFDFGNVLVRWDREPLYRALIPDDERRRFFLDQVCDFEFVHGLCKGRPWDETLAEKLAAHPEFDAELRAYHHRFQEMVIGSVPEGVALLERLTDAGIPCYGLTNWWGETFDEMRPRFRFIERLKYVAVSGHLKMAKPESAFYRHLLDVIGQPPERCAFLDDYRPYVEAAQGLSINAIHFKEDGTAESQLRALGLTF